MKPAKVAPVLQADDPAAVWVARSSLHAWADNPRKNDGEPVAKVMASIKRFGFASPIIARKNGEIIAGHTRFKAAEALGLDRVPVRYMDLDPTEAHLLALADNKLGEEAEWDFAALASQLSAFSLDDAALAGWDSDDLEKLANELGALEPKEVVEDEVPEVPAIPTTKLGDLWLLGVHRVLCGDSTKAEDVARLLGGEKADMMLTDPPYGVSYVGKTKDALKVVNDELDEAGLTKLVCDSFDNAEANCRAGAYWYATVPARPLHILFADDWKRRGILRQIMVWAKDSMVLGHSEYHYKHEPILFGWVPGERHKNSNRTRTTLWAYDRPKASREHPTMKPLALWAQAVQDGSRAAEVVYDPFLGSGTTLIAAEQLGRKCYGMEISPQYCDVIVKRWENLAGKTATLEATC